jgi:L-lactate utilization protein LutC
MNKWTALANKETVEKIIEVLKKNNIDAYFVLTQEEAKHKALDLIPKNARVLASQSQTLEKIGLADLIDNSGTFVSVRKEYMAFDREKEADKIRISRSTPDIIIGSVHAVTEKGEVMIASNMGSQLAAYAYGAKKVIWIVGTQKIVKNLDMGFERIYEHSLPLESERLKKMYGVGSNVSKILIYNRESLPNRTTLIFVNRILGY